MVGRARFWCVWLGSLVACLLVAWLLTATWGVHDITRYVRMRSHPTTVSDRRSPAPFVVVVNWEVNTMRGKSGRLHRESEWFVWFLGAKWSVFARVTAEAIA
jgi:hypothetical protein